MKTETWQIRKCANGHREMLTAGQGRHFGNVEVCSRCKNQVLVTLLASCEVLIEDRSGIDWRTQRPTTVETLVGPLKFEDTSRR